MLNHKGTVTIKTKRLTLRQFELTDASAMYNNWAKDEKVTEYLTWEPYKSVAEAEKILEYWCEAYENESTYNWAIVYDGKPIGNVCVARLSERDERVELGYCIGSDYWNKGIMSEAVHAVIDYLFREVGVHRITISHAAGNLASGKVAMKCGLKYEGTKREYFKYRDGVFMDVIDYSILCDEWA